MLQHGTITRYSQRLSRSAHSVGSPEAYGRARHEAATALWERLDEAEEVLRDVLR
ncbi:hypothetical protein AB0N81_31590 [Streptomyces sp. NPDC093510]|uniref:hypothetical protein n=1 Tax=Streptomyces sp. NPDC093510 TaxID=3155199 RepID=UPI003426A234